MESFDEIKATIKRLTDIYYNNALDSTDRYIAYCIVEGLNKSLPEIVNLIEDNGYTKNIFKETFKNQ